MLLEILPQKAMEILIKKDHLKYCDDIDMLTAEKPSKKIYQTLEGEGLLILSEWDREEGTTQDAILIADDENSARTLVNALEPGIKYYIFLYDRSLTNILTKYLNLEDANFEGGNCLFYTSAAQFQAELPNYIDKVIILDKQHQEIVSQSSSEKTRRYYEEFSLHEPKLYRSYGIIKGGKLVSSCTVDLAIAEPKELNLAEPIWIYTEENYRGQGFGKAILYQAITDLINNGKHVIYHCTEQNKASCSIALASGFMLKTTQYSFVAEIK